MRAQLEWRAGGTVPIKPAIAADHRLVRYDARGNGLSDWDVDDISLDAFVRISSNGIRRYVAATRRRAAACGGVEKLSGRHMYGPAYYRRQAEILARIAKTVSNVDAAAALLELAANHRAWADEGERQPAAQQRSILSKKDRPHPQHR